MSTDWSTGGNWAGGIIPMAGDSPLFPDVGVTRFTVDYSSLAGPSPILLGIDITSNVTNGYLLQGTGASIRFATNGFLHSDGVLANTFNGALSIDSSLQMVASVDTVLNAVISETFPGFLNLTGLLSPTVTLGSSTNTYSGGTFVTSADLKIVSDGSLGISSTGLHLSGGSTLQIGAPAIVLSSRTITIGAGTQGIETLGNQVTIPGPIVGGGTLDITGVGGIVHLPNSNGGYSGTISLQDGTVSIGASGSLGTGALHFDVTPGSTLQAAATIAISNLMTLNQSAILDSQANTFTINGAISGGAGLTKIGSGTAVFTAANTYVGPTHVNVGTLVLNGSITSPTTVAVGATLKGTGTISSTLMVNGTLRPGNSVGTMNVAGPVTFNTGSIYVEELIPSQASLLNVTAGGVTINPGVTLSLIPDAGTYTSGSTYTIIQASGGVNGRFSTVVNATSSLFFVARYTPTTVFLILKPPFSDLVTEGNAGAVAACLDTVDPIPGTDLFNIIDELIFLTDASTLKHAFNQMQPSQYNALQLTQENINTRLFSVLSLRAGEIHRSCKPAGKNWGVWGDVFGDWLGQEHQEGEHGFHAGTGGALFGVDGNVAPQMHVGMGAAFTGTSLEWAGAHGNGNIFSGYGLIYGTWQRPRFFVDAALVGGYNNYETTRHIGFFTIDRHAKAEHGGFTLAGRLTGGFPMKVWDVVDITPVASLDYDFVHQGGFKEHGAKSLNLRVHEKDANLLRFEAGFRVTRRCQTPYVKPQPAQKRWAFFTLPEKNVEQPEISKVRWLPSGQITIIREWRMEGSRTRSRFQDLNCIMSTHGLNPTRTLISPAFGMTWLINRDRIGVTADYAGEFSLDGRFWDQKVNLQVSYTF